MTKEGFSQTPEEKIGDKKEEHKEQSAKDVLDRNIEEIKKRAKPRSWLGEKYDEWRHYGK